MGESKKKDIDEILRKYKGKLSSSINSDFNKQISSFNTQNKDYSKEYIKFKEELSPDISRYEKLCKSLGNLIKLKFSDKDLKKVKRSIEISHLDLEPWQPLNLSVAIFFILFFFSFLISLSYVFINDFNFSFFPFSFFLLMIIFSIFIFYFMNGVPSRIANKWRLKASSQMVPALLYVVVYMRHTSNLERAIAFASEHLDYPLALDLKKVFYDVQMGRFSSVKESLNHYLETWRDYSIEFIEAFNLVESSLYEPDESRRIIALEKSLSVILDGVHEKMLKFTQNVKSPLTNIYMLGIILPTLGLALLPLASTMLGGILKWTHVFVLFNLIIPFFVFYLTDKIIFLRPGGHGESSLLEKNPFYSKYKSKKSYVKYFFLVFPLILIGFLPFIFLLTPFPEMIGLKNDYFFSEIGLDFLGDGSIFGFIDSKGPFGVFSLILSMFIPLGISLFFSLSFKERTKKLILERDKTKNLESEFNGSLFKIGNRVGHGVPVELVFGKVAESSRGLQTENFFKRVDYNIRQMGMSVNKAIFDPVQGALIHYPSELISISMKILIESSKKGLKIAAISVMSISEYVKNINKITSRLRDILSEVISDMKSNMSFLAPLLSGVVVGLAAMITEILSRLNIPDLDGGEALGFTGLGNLLGPGGIFQLENMIPPYFLQIIIGVYLIQIIFILTRTLVIIDSGDDKLQTTHLIGKNFFSGIFLYFLTALFSTIVLFVLVSVVLGGVVS